MSSAALLDIEGTIGNVAFVKQVLFPNARRALPGFVEAHADNPNVAAELSSVAEMAGVNQNDRQAIIETLIGWIDEDRKATPLKALQGMIWKSGYENGEFTAHLYPDAYEWMKRARESGVRLHVYSSGSVAAQKMYFHFSDYGNIVDWFNGFFDTTTGPKKHAASYREIAAKLNQRPETIVFFSDLEAELNAAAEAGMQTAQIVRTGTEPTQHHRQFPDFSSIRPDRP